MIGLPSFAAVREQAAQRTVIDHRLTWRQRDDASAALASLGGELAGLGHATHSVLIKDMGCLVVTCRDAERVAAWLDHIGRHHSAGDTRTALYAAALRLRQIVEV